MFLLRCPRSRMKDLDPLSIRLLRIRAPFQPRHDNTTTERKDDRCTAADNNMCKQENNPNAREHFCDYTWRQHHSLILQGGEGGHQLSSELDDAEEEVIPAYTRSGAPEAKTGLAMLGCGRPRR